MSASPDLLDRVALIRDGARARVESDRERNRREMPACAALMDELTAAFGKPQWLRLTEGGRTVEHGRPLAYTVAVQASATCKPGKPLKERRQC